MMVTALKIVMVVGLLGMLVGMVGMLFSSYVIATICAEKKISGDWKEGEQSICRRHGHL